MSPSVLVETSLNALAERLGLSQLVATSADELNLPKRLEAQSSAWIIRQISSGRLTADLAAFHPYTVRRGHISGDMWAASLLGVNHGLIVVRAFSDWVPLLPLIHHGLINEHEANCAYNRMSSDPSGDPRRRLVLANFTPDKPLFVPVLFDRPEDPAVPSRFVMVSAPAPEDVRAFGVHLSPISLTQAAAIEWLDTSADPEPEAAALAEKESTPEAIASYFEEVLEDSRGEAYSFSLYKSA